MRGSRFDRSSPHDTETLWRFDRGYRGEAASEGGLIAHQVHGAIGFTADHPLHRYVQRMWSWRDQFGREAVWAERLGRHFAAQGGDAFWKTITAA